MALNNNEEGFNPLDTLGPAVGSINALNPDATNYTPFEGDPIDFGKTNPPALENPLVPRGLVNQSKRVQKYIVGKPPKKGGITYNSRGIDPREKVSLIKNYLTSLSQSHAQKGSHAKLYSYNAGSSGNAHFKRYYAYGPETFDKIGFNPMKNNEALFNENTSVWQDFGRQLTHSFVPLFTRGFTAGPESLFKMITGDFTSSDLSAAREYEEAAAIGTSTKTGLVPFLSNTFMNFGYTAGIISEIATEEIVGGLLAPVTGGLSFLGATKNSLSNVYKAAKGLKFAKDAENTVQTVQSLNNLKSANSFWKDANYLLDTPVGSFINPVNNARRSFQNAKASNLTNLATAFKTAGGFYQDVRSINAAVSESRLESGLVQDKVYNNKYDQFYLRNKRTPTNKEQEDMTKISLKAGLETFYKNVGLIYGTNKITFGNILNKGGIKNYFKNATQDIMNVSHKSFGTIGRVLYDKTAKQFLYQSSVGYQGFKNLAKSWMKQPLSKSVLGSVKYFKSNFSEGFQENAQEIIARANEKWYTDSYNSPYLKASLFNNAVNSINLKNNSGTPLSVYNAELNKEFSAQGLETFGSGFFMGTLGGGMNKTFSLLQNAYGRIFDKAGYKAWTEQKEAVTNTLINELNKIDINDLLSNKYVNAGSQDTLSLIKEQANTKESKDAELDSLINQVSTMIKTGSSEIFQDKLKSLREISDEALQEELKFDNIKDAERYRLKIDKTINKIDSIKEAYETVSENFPNPINNDNMPDRSDPNYVEAAALRNGWDVAVKNIVYANEAFKDVANRISSIKQTYLKNSTLKNVSSSKISPLFQVKLLADSINSFELELDMLKKGVKSKTSTTIESDKIKINDLEEEISTLKEFKTSYDAFNRFTNRSEYTKEVQEELQQDTEQDITAEDIEEKMSKLYGKEDDEEKMIELLSNLKKSHDSYLRTLAKAQDTNIFSTELDDAFVQLVDFYKLNKDSRNLASHIELLSDPENFYGLVRKNTEWSKRLYKNRKKYFRDLVKQEIANIESNALLNAMADEGLYMSANDYSDWQTLRTRPSEFFNSIDGEVYKIDTVKYNEIYDKYLSKDRDLKAKSKFSEVSNVIADYTEELVDLEEKKQNEIDLLEKTVTQIPEESIKLKGNNDSISIKNVNNELNNNSYIELTPKNSETTIILYKDDQGVLRYNDETGDVYDLNDKTKFTENKVYSEELIPDPIKVTEIENRYAKEKLDIIENFKTSRSLTDLEFEDPYIIGESDFKTMSDGLKDKLYKDFQTTLPSKTTEDKINAPDASSKAFQDWVNTDSSAKAIIDEFNKDIELISEFTFQNNDKTVNTNDLTSSQIIDVVNEKSKELTKLKEELSKLKEDDPNYNIKKLEIETLNEETKKLLKVNKSRSLQERTTPQKKVIKEIEKLIALNKSVQKDYVLTEDDPVTGLKKGDKAYLIDNLVHRRVTNAIQAYLEKYEYSSYKLVEKSYDDTIRKNGLNEASVDAFIKLLKDGGASGINDKLFTELSKDIKSFITSNVVNNKIKSLNDQIESLKEDIKLSKQAKNKDRVKTLNAELKTLTAELAALGTTQKSDQVAALRVAEDFKENYNNGKLTKGDFGGSRNLGVFDYKGKIIKVVKKKRTISPDQIQSMKDRLGDMDNVYFSEESIDLGDNKVAIVMSKAKGIDASNLTKKDIDSIPQEHWNKFEQDVRELSKRGVKIDLTKRDNLFYDKSNGFGFIDINGISMDESSTDKFFEKDGIEYYYPFEQYRFFPNQFEGGKVMFESIPESNTKSVQSTALGTDTKVDVNNEELFDKVLNLISEKSYEDGRVAGNYVDLIKDYFQYGKKPEFDEKIISKKAYEELFNDDTGYIVQLGKKFKDEGYYIVGNNLVVWDSNIVTEEGKKDRIAGEIDLIVVDKKGNAFIIDIKTGSKSKWTNFNQLTNSFDNKKYSKRNEYTLQQAVYRELLKRQTGVETEIGLLPIERESDKETDQIISAKKPLAAGLAKEVIYEFDDDGKVKKNKFKDPKGDKDFEEKIFKPGPNNAINDIFIPLSLESVAEEIDDLLAPKDDEGAQSFSFESPDIKQTSQEIQFLKNKNAVIINSYKKDLENSQISLDKLENILKSITIPDISNITIGNAFIADRLKVSEDGDNKFKNYYDKHKSFEDSTKPPHENQLMAAKILNATKIITDVEYQSIESQDLNMAEVSELIHNAVIRIEYLIANDTSNAQEFKVYQKTLFSYMGQSSFHMNLQDTVNVLGNLNKTNYNSLLTNEILKLTNKLQYAKIDFQKKNIEASIEKLTNLKDNLLSLYGEVKEEFISPIEVNSRYFKNNKDYTQVTVMKVDGDKITIKGNRKNSKESIVSTKDLLNKDLYLTSEDIENLKSEESTYEANESEKTILKEVQNTTDTFINSTEDKNKATEIGLKDNIKKIEDDLLTKIKNCQ